MIVRTIEIKEKLLELYCIEVCVRSQKRCISCSLMKVLVASELTKNGMSDQEAIDEVLRREENSKKK